MRSLISRFTGGNEASLGPLRRIVARINELEAHYKDLTDEQIRAEMADIRAEVREAAAYREADEEERTADSARRADLRRAREKENDKRLQAALDEALPDVFAAAREVARRARGMRHYDVQLMGGAVLHQGRIAEMKTGEGKTDRKSTRLNSSH